MEKHFSLYRPTVGFKLIRFSVGVIGKEAVWRTRKFSTGKKPWKTIQRTKIIALIEVFCDRRPGFVPPSIRIRVCVRRKRYLGRRIFVRTFDWSLEPVLAVLAVLAVVHRECSCRRSRHDAIKSRREFDSGRRRHVVVEGNKTDFVCGVRTHIYGVHTYLRIRTTCTPFTGCWVSAAIDGRVIKLPTVIVSFSGDKGRECTTRRTPPPVCSQRAINDTLEIRAENGFVWSRGLSSKAPGRRRPVIIDEANHPGEAVARTRINWSSLTVAVWGEGPVV